MEMPLYANGVRLSATSERVIGAAGTVPPANLQSRHGWTTSFPWSDSAGAVNVKTKYGAAGDGTTDDTAAIQAAIDANELVFLPKGYYAVSAPLQLKPNTKLVGVSQVLSVIVAMNKGAFADPTHPRPIIATADDAEAQTVLSNLGVYVPVSLQGAYAVDWRAGDKSVWRFTEARLFYTTGFKSSGAKSRPVPLVQLSGNAGGRWYAFQEQTGVMAGSANYRMLNVNGTQHPLRFYHLDPEHMDLADAYVSIENSKNVAIFGFKTENTPPGTPYSNPAPIVVWIKGSQQISLFGAGGYVTAKPDDGSATPPSLFRIDDSTDFRLVSLVDRWGTTAATQSVAVSERITGASPTRTALLERPISYARDPSVWNSVTPPRRGP